MRLIQFLQSGRRAVGAEITPGGNILDISKCIDGFPNDMISVLSSGDTLLQKIRKTLEHVDDKHVIKRDNVELLSPVTKPDKLICIGMNYKDHCEEQGVPVPKEPVVFSKFPSTIIGPQDDIPYPRETEKLDWEVELAIVVGKAGKHIPLDAANDHIAGYTCAHDVSARDWQLERNGGQWLLGKSMDAFCPLGPVLLTRDSMPDVSNLNLSCSVNGVAKQSSNTREMIHRPDALITFLSRFITLLPGDVILTGTPPGVGVFKKPPEYLKKGDVVECHIESIGSVRNKIT